MTRVREVYESLYSTNGIAGTTLANQRSLLTRWERLTPDHHVEAITTQTIEDYRAACVAAGLSNDATESGIRMLMTVLRVAERSGMIQRVPWSGKKLRCRQTPKYVPTLHEIGLLYEHADAAKWPRGVDRPRFWRSVICVCLWTGFRCSDLFWRFRREGVTEHALSVAANKTGKFHIFPRHPVVDRHLAMVENWWTDRVYQVGRSYKQIHRSFVEMSDAAGVRRITCQPLRRASITAWERAKPGAGSIVQGCTLNVAYRHYIDAPQLLKDGAAAFRFPESMLLPEEIESQKLREAALLESFRRLGSDDQKAVQALASKLAS